MSNSQYSSFEKAFIAFAKKQGYENFEKDDNGFTCLEVRQAYSFYKAGMKHHTSTVSGCFIIGSVENGDRTGTIAFGKVPVKHSSYVNAVIEMKRLANRHKDRHFIVFSATTAHLKHDVARTLMQRMRHKSFTYADDGFGNLIKVPHETRVNVYRFHFNNQDMMNEYNQRNHRWASEGC